MAPPGSSRLPAPAAAAGPRPRASPAAPSPAPRQRRRRRRRMEDERRLLRALKDRVLRLPPRERAAFTYAYQREPQLVQRVETPPLRYLEAELVEPEQEEEGALDVEKEALEGTGRIYLDAGDGETTAAEETAAEAAARRMCAYWAHKWELFCSGPALLLEEDRGGREDGRRRRCCCCLPAKEDPSGAARWSPPPPPPPPVSPRERLLGPLALSSLSEGARAVLASGRLSVLADVRAGADRPPGAGGGPLFSCPVVCLRFDGGLPPSRGPPAGPRDHLQAAFYFWNVMLCRERWRRRRSWREERRGDDEEEEPVLLPPSSTRYVGLVCVDPGSGLDGTVQEWVDAALGCAPIHARSLHVLACASSASSSSPPPPPAPAPARFYGVVLPRAIKVFGKLLRDRDGAEVRVHVRNSLAEFASALAGGGGGDKGDGAGGGERFRAEDLPDFLGGSVPWEASWREALAEQSRREGGGCAGAAASARPAAPLDSCSAEAVAVDVDALRDDTTPRPHPLPDCCCGAGAVAGAISGSTAALASADDDEPGGMYHGGRGAAADPVPWNPEGSAAAGGDDRDESDDEIDIVSLLRFFHDHDEPPASLPASPGPPSPSPLPVPDPALDQRPRPEPLALGGAALSPEMSYRTLEDALRLVDAEEGANGGPDPELAALRDALASDPALVERESPWRLFLLLSGGGGNDPRRALARLGRCWALRRNLFGSRAHLLPMSMTGEGAMGRKEAAFVRSSGCIQWLPCDSAGRSVLYLDAVGALAKSEEGKADRSVVLRCLFYAFHVVVTDQARRLARNETSGCPEGALFRAEVVVLCPGCSASQVAASVNLHGHFCRTMRLLWEAHPLVPTSIHMFLTDVTRPGLDLSSECNRSMIFHLYGFQPSCIDSHRQHPDLLVHSSGDALDHLGLTARNLPESIGGSFSRSHFQQWLELRVRCEWDVPAGSRNKEIVGMFDFSRVMPVHELGEDELRERKRRMNILHTRRKRDREQAEGDRARDRAAALHAENGRLRADNTRLERVLLSARQVLAAEGKTDPSGAGLFCELDAPAAPRTFVRTAELVDQRDFQHLQWNTQDVITQNACS